MNHGPAFMVDGPGTVDRDDAIRIDTAEDGSRTLAVFVADVTGAIDADPGVLELALSRGATIYRRQIAVQAMLPPEIERAYTLAEGEARRALAIRMPLGEDGLPGDPVIERCVLEHAVALTHQDAGIAVKDRRHRTTRRCWNCGRSRRCCSGPATVRRARSTTCIAACSWTRTAR